MMLQGFYGTPDEENRIVLPFDKELFLTLMHGDEAYIEMRAWKGDTPVTLRSKICGCPRVGPLTPTHSAGLITTCGMLDMCVYIPKGYELTWEEVTGGADNV